MDFIFDPSLVLCLPLYELDGASFISREAYGHLCTVTGAIWTPRGRNFDGVDDNINCGNASPLRITGAITLEGWVNVLGNLTAGAVPKALIARTGSGWATYGYMIFADNYNSLMRWGCHFSNGVNDWNQVTLNNSVVYGKWTHVTATYDGISVASLYLDGEQVKTNSYAITMVANANLIRVGTCDNTNYLNSIIGEVRIYNRALTPLEVQHHYLATKWRYR